METQRSLPYPLSVHNNGNGVLYQHLIHRVAAPPTASLTTALDLTPPSSLLAPPLLPPPADFEVDDLLDFPTDYDSTEILDSLPSSKVLLSEVEPSSKSENLITVSAAATITATIASKTTSEVKPAAQTPLPSSSAGAGLCNLPPDELATELEWLSGFNEDSSYTVDTKLVSLVNSTGIKDCESTPVKAQEKRESFFIQSPISVLEQSPNSFRLSRPKRSRTARNGGRVWSLDILKPRHKVDKGSNSLLLTKSSSNEFLWSSLNQEAPEKPAKKPKKQSSSLNSQDASQIRRCSHCLVQKTPQWRAGPLGPKTLCNACGVRYKSGRLLPEYRPASSPTFLSEVHSNSHRRILEMRRAKELESQTAQANVKCDQVQDEDCVSETEQCKASPSVGHRSDFREQIPTSKEVSSACGSCTLSGQSTICDETSMLMSEAEANENTNPVCYDEITSSEQVTVRTKEEGRHEQDSMTSLFVEENHEECKGTLMMIGIGSDEKMK